MSQGRSHGFTKASEAALNLAYLRSITPPFSSKGFWKFS
jgi:hypothetical protein